MLGITLLSFISSTLYPRTITKSCFLVLATSILTIVASPLTCECEQKSENSVGRIFLGSVLISSEENKTSSDTLLDGESYVPLEPIMDNRDEISDREERNEQTSDTVSKSSYSTSQEKIGADQNEGESTATNPAIQPLFKWFMKRVENSLEGTTMSTFEFDTEAMELGKELSAIDALVKNAPPSKVLSNQLRVAKHMFDLENVTRHMLNFHTLTSDERKLVRHMIRVNIRLFSVYDEYGKPRSEFAGNSEMVSLLIEELVYWKINFSTMIDIPQSVRTSLENQLSETEYLLHVLQ